MFYTSANKRGFKSYCSAYLSTIEEIDEDVYTKIRLDRELFDNDNEFDHITNYRFTAKATGYYLVTANMGFVTEESSRTFLAIYKNGSAVAVTVLTGYDTFGLYYGISKLIYLEKDDYIELYAQMKDVDPAEIINGADVTYMTIHRIA